jgi:gamma-carbonic anhydrase
MIEDYQGIRPSLHPEAFVHRMATVIGQVELAAESSVWPGAVLRGDDGLIRVGRLSSIQDGTVIHNTEGLSTTEVGERVTVGHNVTLHGCHVEDDCLVGMGAVILDNAHIGAGSVIGAASFVPAGKVIPPGSLVLGSPARVVRAVSERERGMITTGWQAYQARGAIYRAAALRPSAPETDPDHEQG